MTIEDGIAEFGFDCKVLLFLKTQCINEIQRPAGIIGDTLFNSISLSRGFALIVRPINHEIIITAFKCAFGIVFYT